MTAPTAPPKMSFLDRTEQMLDRLEWQPTPQLKQLRKLFDTLADTCNSLLDITLECRDCRTAEPTNWEPGYCSCGVTLGQEQEMAYIRARLRRVLLSSPGITDTDSVLMVELLSRAAMAHIMLRDISVGTLISDVANIPGEAIRIIEAP